MYNTTMIDPSQNITTYLPNQRLNVGFFQVWILMFRNIVNSKDLIWQLFRRDFFMAYKKTFLGFSWVLVSPLIGIASWIFLNSAGILEPGETNVPFPVYVLLGSTLWGLFMGLYTASLGTLNAGSGFIMQVKFPHEVLLIKQVAQFFANFSITFFVNIVVLLAFGVIPSIYILLFPIFIIPIFLLAVGMGLIMSVVSIVAADVSSFVNIILGFIFYATPIVYQIDSIQDNRVKTLIELNPFTYLVAGLRDIIIFGTLEYPERYTLISLLTLLFFLFAWRFFYISEDKVIERML